MSKFLRFFHLDSADGDSEVEQVIDIKELKEIINVEKRYTTFLSPIPLFKTHDFFPWSLKAPAYLLMPGRQEDRC